ncbi:type VI secretion system baseplate subunit TssF [Paraburkholderia aspalathi]|nr:type VI secretion system baseplate subunit TssF [Paraburkholderia aspalathi]
MEGILIPRGTSFVGLASDRKSTACEYRSSLSVTIWLLEIIDAKLTVVPLDLQP